MQFIKYACLNNYEGLFQEKSIRSFAQFIKFDFLRLSPNYHFLTLDPPPPPWINILEELATNVF